MRIHFLLTQDLESPSGLGRYLPLARELARLEHQVRITALHSNMGEVQRPSYERDGVLINYVAQMHVRKHGNLKTYYPTHKLLSIATEATWKLALATFSTETDIVHIGKPHPMNSIAGVAAKYFKKRKLFLDCDDSEVGSGNFNYKWQKAGVALFEKWMPYRAHVITTNTLSMRDNLIRLGIPDNNVIYLPNGVDRDRFSTVKVTEVERVRANLRLNGKSVIAFIGSLSLSSHPVDLLMKAFIRIQQTIPDVVLLIVGGGEDYERLKKQAQVLGIQNSTRFCGRIPSNEIPIYYHLAHVSVDPVYDNEAARHRSPVKLFESWVSGIPFVTADVGDRKLLLGDPPAGLLAKSNHPEMLAEAIITILTHKALAQVLAQRGQKRAEEYYWSNLVQRLDKAYRLTGPV